MRRAFSKPVPPHQIDQLVRDFRAEGYEGLQLKQGQYIDDIDRPQAALERWGDVEGAFSGLIMFDTLEPDGVSRLRRVVAFAEAVGSERVIFCHDHSRDGVDADALRGFARILSDEGLRARDRGVALSLHHHFGQPVMLPDDMRVFFDAIAPKAVGLTLDTAHVAKAGISDLPGLCAEFASEIDNIHLKDYADGDWRLLGQGDLPLAETLDSLTENGYDGWLCVDEESAAPLVDGFRTSLTWLEAHGR